MKSKEEITNALDQFCGTERYHKFSILYPRLVLTDGVKFLCVEAECFWLMDIIGSYQKQLAKEPFQVWKLVVADRKAVVTCIDGNDKEVVRQEVGYTDFPLESIELYCIDGEYKVILLTSEY